MTEDKLQAIKKQLAALPPATWTPVAVWDEDGNVFATGPTRTNEDDAVRDAYFIAHAPANMAALLAHVDELQAKLDAVPVTELLEIIDSALRWMVFPTDSNAARGSDKLRAWLETQVTP